MALGRGGRQFFSFIAPLEVIWPGRSIKLKLRGPHGALDILVNYFPTGATVTELDLFGVDGAARDALTTFPTLRARMRNRLAGRIAPKDK
eukprot:6818315-Pyramimonas_sp.AAC.1